MWKKFKDVSVGDVIYRSYTINADYIKTTQYGFEEIILRGTTYIILEMDPLWEGIRMVYLQDSFGEIVNWRIDDGSDFVEHFDNYFWVWE